MNQAVTVNDSNLRGTLSMNASLSSTGDVLSTANVAQAVWSALATSNNEAGSMGAKLNSAASGGVDLNALGAAVWANATRTLTDIEVPTTAEITAALIAALNSTTIPVDLQKVRGQQLAGSGIEADPWRPQ
jgi:hypothetical protein